ncbi:hypothetical protein GUITHDRAFT_106944 [Guillardia theta CCMP2712]|uniref:Uncharacterized protein n=1 Tax=Guillardia theta (strain CCMP2712) TaxID=905079 RepID=L1JEV7_GUITC|nr:hypothetical protein GUITHDRAFT_106944 [Guillardia theta CCMP2712]EKX47031.1 hypothetical protein GUITHDRAFT_106944 [Guillardia theta CCMP2712]|eukprot:XP_005834011.1 hypothetical protein GUITHDRAFT_106944 [Guillardia theta CCMP2712]
MRESINKMLQQVKDGVTPWQAAQEVRVRQPRNHARPDTSTRVRSQINSVRPRGEECWFTPKEGHPNNRSELSHWQNANLNDTKEADGQDQIIEFIHARLTRLGWTIQTDCTGKDGVFDLLAKVFDDVEDLQSNWTSCNKMSRPRGWDVVMVFRSVKHVLTVIESAQPERNLQEEMSKVLCELDEAIKSCSANHSSLVDAEEIHHVKPVPVSESEASDDDLNDSLEAIVEVYSRQDYVVQGQDETISLSSRAKQFQHMKVSDLLARSNKILMQEMKEFSLF